MGGSGERAIPWWHRAALALEARLERSAYAQRRRRARPARIVAYRAFANASGVTLSGRVLADAPAAAARSEDRAWRNLVATFRRFASHELPDVELVCRFAGVEVATRTDAEGYYRARIEIPGGVSGPLWQDGEVALADGTLATRQAVMVVPREARFGIVSDVDDTVLESSVTRWPGALERVLLRNARTRKPLEGVAELYAALQRGLGPEPMNPVFYVSSSPWNLYDLLDEFLALNAIPPGPIFLRDLGFDPEKFLKSPGHGHKLDTLRALIGEFPDLAWVLIGDSGQHDAMLYAQAAREFPEKIRAIYIRDVDPSLDSPYDAFADGRSLRSPRSASRSCASPTAARSRRTRRRSASSRIGTSPPSPPRPPAMRPARRPTR